ncbi:hypothetical protein, partial [Bosea sp. FBZP-16]
KGTGSDALQVGIGSAAASGAAAITDAQTGGANTAVGFAAADRTGAGLTSSGITSAVRSNLIDQYNDLR